MRVHAERSESKTVLSGIKLPTQVLCDTKPDSLDLSRTVSPKIALGARLKSCRNVMTLGFKPNFNDYSQQESDLIRNADKIYYPTAFYAHLFHTMGKPTFPSFSTYHFVQDKIRQSALFNLLDIPHPFTRVFYGAKQKQEILNLFTFPFIAKKPRGSSMGRGVYLINDKDALFEYLAMQGSKSAPMVDSDDIIPKRDYGPRAGTEPAYIQEYCPHDRDIRVVIIGKEIMLAYWRVANSMDFRSNISCGGDILFDQIPDKALQLALHTALKCGWDDVGLDLVEKNGDFIVIEANMKYGKKGFVKAGIDYTLLLENLIETGAI